jgi:hypothetical protein
MYLWYLRFSQPWLWRISSSGIWRCVVCWVVTDVSEEHIASIFRVEEIIQQEPASCLPPAYLLVLAELSLRPWIWRRYVVYVLLFHAHCMLRPSNPPWFDHPNNISRGVQIMKLLVMQFFPASCYFLRLGSKCSPQHSLLLWCEMPSFTSIQRRWGIILWLNLLPQQTRKQKIPLTSYWVL